LNPRPKDYDAGARGRGKPPPNGTIFSTFFEQASYTMTGAPKELRQQIDKIFVISVEITQNLPSAKPDPKGIQSEAPLLGTGYSVKRP
jgi:hypothetical protein